MTERSPVENIDYINSRVQEAIKRVGDGIQVGTVTVTYEGKPYWPTGDIWVQAGCDVCGAHVVERTPGYEAHLRLLAHTVMTAFCNQELHGAHDN